MKLKNIAKKLIVFAVVTAVFITTTVVVFAVGEEGDTVDTTPVYTQATETLPPDTEPVTEPTTVSTTVADTEPVQTEPTTQAVTQTVETQETEAPYSTYATTSPVTSPTKAEEIYTKPTAVRVEKEKKPESYIYGIVSWICVIVGVLVVIVVLISNKTTYYGGSGKQRYDEGDRITGKKHLLNDDYYNSRKQSSYYNKDNRK